MTECGRFMGSSGSGSALAAQPVSRSRDVVEHVFRKNTRFADALASKASKGIRQVCVSEDIPSWKAIRTVKASWNVSKCSHGSDCRIFVSFSERSN